MSIREISQVYAYAMKEIQRHEKRAGELCSAPHLCNLQKSHIDRADALRGVISFIEAMNINENIK
jgi:hypothetical protein